MSNSNIKLRVGGTYRLRNGWTARCEELYYGYGRAGDSHHMCRYVVGGCCYQEDGAFAGGKFGNSEHDVVEEIADDSFGTFADAKDSLAQGEPVVVNDKPSLLKTLEELHYKNSDVAVGGKKEAADTLWSKPEIFRALVKDQEKLDTFITPDLPAGDTKGSILDEAKNAVTKRRENYGSPKPNFERIAALWDAYFMAVVDKRVKDDGGDTMKDYNSMLVAAAAHFTTADVAAMMRLVKEARLIETPDHRDSLVDIAGYAACSWDCVSDEDQ
jgi:hypothetical protein